MESKVIKNASWIIGCKIVKAFLTILVSVLTARYLGNSDYGLINYAAGIVAFLTPIMKLGLDSTLVQETVEHPEEEGEIFGTGIVMNILSGVLCILFIIPITMIANSGETDTVIVCVTYSVLLIFQATEMIQYWFQAKLLSKYSSMAMLVSYIVLTVFQITLIINNADIYWFALSHTVDFLVISIILFAVYGKIGRQRLSFSCRTAKRLWNNGKHFIIPSLMVTVFSQTDRIMLKLMIDNAAVGIYSAAVTCAGMLSFVFVAVIDSVKPTIFGEADKEARDCKLVRLYSVIVYLSLSVSLIITAFAPLIIGILYGEEYGLSIPILRISVWFTTFSYVGSIRNIWLLSEQKQKYLWIVNLSGAVANIVLNWFFISFWGIAGAALASVLTQILTNVVVTFFIAPIANLNRLMWRAINPKECMAVIGDVAKFVFPEKKR